MDDHEQTADILDGAADVIERDGWTQFTLADDYGRCALGALRKVAQTPLACQVEKRITESLVSYLGVIPAPARSDVSPMELAITDWNDAPERTKQEVLDALRSAAKDQRKLADGLAS